MQRIHFTAEDLANVRVASQPWPMVETIFALQRLQGSDAGVLFDRWRTQTWDALRALRHARKLLHCLFDLVPPHGFIPDFMCSVAGAADGLDPWLDRVLASPPSLVWADMEEYAKVNGRPSKWLGSLAAGDRESFSVVASALRSFYSTAIGREWTSVVASVEAERASRARDLLDGWPGCLTICRAWRAGINRHSSRPARSRWTTTSTAVGSSSSRPTTAGRGRF